jgi:hypothetical protein
MGKLLCDQHKCTELMMRDSSAVTARSSSAARATIRSPTWTSTMPTIDRELEFGEFLFRKLEDGMLMMDQCERDCSCH